MTAIPQSPKPLTAQELRDALISITSSSVQPVSIESLPVAQPFDIRLDEVDAVTYMGEANPGSSESASVWRIRKIDETSGTSVMYAGDATFGYRWDQRDSLNYS